MAGSRKLEHVGIKVELIGQIEMLQDRSNTYEFTSLVRELEPAGEVQGSKAYPFEFTGVEKQYESYDGINVRLRYFVRVTIMRQYSSRIVHEETIRVHVATDEPEATNSIKMEVGIEDCLHIEFEYNKSRCVLPADGQETREAFWADTDPPELPPCTSLLSPPHPSPSRRPNTADGQIHPRTQRQPDATAGGPPRAVRLGPSLTVGVCGSCPRACVPPRAVATRCRAQVSSQRCRARQDLLSARADKNQAHGGCHHQAREHGHWREYV